MTEALDFVRETFRGRGFTKAELARELSAAGYSFAEVSDHVRPMTMASAGPRLWELVPKSVSERREVSDPALAEFDGAILHISDLHFTPRTAAIAEVGPLAADLGSFEHSAVSFVAMSGDFADKGDIESYERTREFCGLLLEELGLAEDRCILVPGNHDVDWTFECHRYSSKRARPDIPELGLVYDKVVVEPDYPRYDDRFRHFSSGLFEPINGRAFDGTSPGSVSVVDHSDAGVVFLAINSAIFSDEFATERCAVAPEGLASGLTRFRSVARSSTVPLVVVALMHHPLGDCGAGAVEQLRLAGTSVVLHGHVHEPAEASLYSHEGGGMHVVGAGSFGATGHARPESTPQLYNLLEFSRTQKRVRVHTRRRMVRDGPWDGYAIWRGSSGEYLDYYEKDLKLLVS
jgi:predicted phosphodiesterase